MVKVEKIEEEVDEINTFITQTTEALESIIITLKAMDAKQKLIWESINGVAQKEVKESEPVYRKASPGFDFGKSSDGEKKVKQKDVIPVQGSSGKTDSKSTRRVESYTKKSGELGYKIVGGDVIFEKKAYRYIQECNYGCGNYVSFDNYKKGDKPLHISTDLEAIGKYCPKYE